MPRPPKYSWHDREQCYRTDSGGRTKYFRGIARGDYQGIAKAFDQHLQDLDAERRPRPASVTDVCLAFTKATRGVEDRTVRTHKERLHRFCAYPEVGSPEMYGAKSATSIKAADLRAALRAWEDQGLSANYRAGIARSVKAAFAWAARSADDDEGGGGLIPADPFAKVKAPKTGKGPDRYASRDEVAAFLRFAWRRAGASTPLYRHFGRRLVRLVQLGLHTGNRPGEARLAEWHDFDPKARLLSLPAAKVKTRKPRSIVLPAPIVRALVRERDRPGRAGSYLFPHKRGKGALARGVDDAWAGEPWDGSALAQAVRKIRLEAIAEGKRLAAAGLPTRGLDLIQDQGEQRFVLYRLRHTSHARALERGGTVAEVAALHGNSARTVEESYTGLQLDHLRGVAERLRGKGKAGG